MLSFTPLYISFNRTIQELKSTTLLYLAIGAEAFNRTIQELKCFYQLIKLINLALLIEPFRN